MEKLETIADVRKELDWMKRKKELDTTGFFYNRSDITREGLIEKYGEDLVESIDESHCENWLEVVNDFDHEMFVENYHLIPMGLEKKISLGWFMHFFSWMKMDTYSVGIEGASFHGNWLDVPYPYADEIVLSYPVIKRDLPDPCYNWYELFLIIDEMMWEGGRCLDIGITNIGIESNSSDNKVISVGWSS
jgi:hypothetical protein